MWNWFSKFHSANMSMRDESRSGCSLDIDQDALWELMEYSSCKSTWELALDQNTSQSTISCHLKKIGKVWKLGVLVSHTLSEKHMENCIPIATSLLSSQWNDLLLKNINEADKKLMFYDNVQCKKQWINKDESLQPTPPPQKKKKIWSFIEQRYAVCMVR